VRDFNVTVPGGSVVALVGRSGAGKTTVTDLVARFHDPTRGRILLNGTDIRDFKLRSYRDLLAIVQQDVFLFATTSPTVATTRPRPRSWTRRAARTRTSSSTGCPRSTKRSSANVA
jgi:ABC-type transport system involved in Fe-S cluster assembly fused permease/ATPase subunit